MTYEAMTEAEFNSVLMEARNTTALGRISLAEVKEIFARLEALGCRVVKVED